MLTGDINNAQWEKLNLWGGGIRSLPGEKEEGKEQYNHSLEGPWPWQERDNEQEYTYDIHKVKLG